jgi:transcriptional regulator with XRE-family HTH domain
MNIGRGIKKILEEKDISQKKLSDETGISETSISLLIKNKTQPRKETLEKIGNALGVKPEVLLVLSLDKEDVPDTKKDYYDELWPTIERTLLNMFSTKTD